MYKLLKWLFRDRLKELQDKVYRDRMEYWSEQNDILAEMSGYRDKEYEDQHIKEYDKRLEELGYELIRLKIIESRLKDSIQYDDWTENWIKEFKIINDKLVKEISEEKKEFNHLL